MDVINNPYRGYGIDGLDDVPSPSTDAAAPRALLARCPRARATPLVTSPGLAAALGTGEVFVKDERARMDLGSFKALGAAYVIACDAEKGLASGQTYITASAGNHGISVAAGAAVFGARAVIYLSEQVPEAFADRLRSLGADVVRAGAEYEASMAAAAQAAQDTGAVLLSDSSWSGYIDRPWRLMEGYLVLMAETFTEMNAPTHIFLQAGVGGLAGAAAAAARAEWGEKPWVGVVEPDVAPALQASIKAGKPVHAPGPVSIMGRLDCKEPSLIALKGLSRDADAFLTISETEGQAGADLAAAHGMPSSPSGAAGLAGAMVSTLTPDDRVLVILSEAST